MSDPASPEESRDPVEVLAEHFLERHRRGERPTVEEYAARHPELAGRIEDLFPALLAMEEAGPDETLKEGPGARGRESPPERLGEYRVLREIGRGGMGVVYEAEQESLNRRVAVKVLLHRAFSDDNDLERFRREARAAARLHHTNIVPVFGIGEDEGIHYYAMQYIHGQSLAGVLSEVRRMRSGETVAGTEGAGDGSSSGLLKGHSPSAGEPVGDYYRNVAALGLQAAEALAYAHGEGILHRDVKPSNLLLDTRGFLWVTDFGLAKAADSGELTTRGNIVGTLRYMAPERLGGTEDARSDIYSLGITLYEALTLRPAFDSTDKARLIHDLASHEPPAPRGIHSGIPRDLETIILRATAKDPRDRYPAAIDLADDLRRFLANEPVRARRAWVAERLWRWCQRNPAVAGLSAALVVLLAALAAGGMLSARSLRKERDAAFGLLMSSKLEEGRAWQRSGALGQRIRSLDAFREASAGSPSLTLRNEVIGSLILKDMKVEKTWEMPEGWLYIDNYLERSASRGPGNTVLVRAGWPPGETIAVLPGGPEPAEYMLFSPSGRFFATIHGEKSGLVVIWDLETKKAVLELPSVIGIPIAFHPREDAIALADPGGLSIRSFPEGREIRRLPPGPRCHNMSFDPEGRRLAVVPADSNAHVVRIHDTESGVVTARLHHGEAVSRAAWHPGGGLVATACTDFKVYIWEPDTGRRVRVLEGHGAEVTRVAFSHDGALLASTGWDDQTFLWDALSWERLVASTGTYKEFSRDDRRLGFREGSRRLGTWELVGGAEHRQLGAPSGSRREKHPQDIAISPEGRWLAAERGIAGVRIWSLGAPEHKVDLEIGWTTGVRFHPAGDSLLTSGAAGLLRWPVHEGAYGLWTFGPPEPLGLAGSRFSLDARGRSLALLRGRRISVHDLEDPRTAVAAMEHENAHRVELSPSGRWVVTTTWQGSEARVWESRAGILVAAIPARSAQARFSPDERWLAVSTEHGFTVHETGSWSAVGRIERAGGGDIPGTLAFSADSRLIALLVSPGVIHLHRTETWGEVARLQPVGKGHGGWMDLTPSGSLLAMAEPTLQSVKLWDIAAIRRELRALGLDWDGGVEEGATPPLPSQLAVDHGTLARSSEAALGSRARDLALVEAATRWLQLRTDREHVAARAEAHRRLGALEEALADLAALVALEREGLAADPSPAQGDRLRAALRVHADLCAETGRIGEAIEDHASVLDLDPGSMDSGLEAAWLWAAAPLPAGEGDLPRVLIEKAVAREPSDARMLIAQGAVYYRLGRLADAERVLEEAIRLQGDGAPAPALLLLALVSHRSEKAEKARELYRRAAAAPPERADTLGKLTPQRSKLLRAEAEGILAEPRG